MKIIICWSYQHCCNQKVTTKYTYIRLNVVNRMKQNISQWIIGCVNKNITNRKVFPSISKCLKAPIKIYAISSIKKIEMQKYGTVTPNAKYFRKIKESWRPWVCLAYLVSKYFIPERKYLNSHPISNWTITYQEWNLSEEFDLSVQLFLWKKGHSWLG